MNAIVSANDLYNLEAEIELLGMLIQDNNRNGTINIFSLSKNNDY